MTVREAILLSIPVFASHARGGPSDVRAALEAAGVPPDLAAALVEFLPVALAMLDGMGLRFADHYVRQTAQGRVIGRKALADEPVYREGVALAGEISGGGEAEFMAVAGCSLEYRAVRQAMNSGGRPEDIECSP